MINKEHAITDNYAEYQRVRNMAIEFCNVFFTLKYCSVRTLEPDENDWEEAHQTYMIQVQCAKQLALTFTLRSTVKSSSLQGYKICMN